MNMRTCAYCKKMMEVTPNVIFSGKRYYHQECWPKKLAKDEAKKGGSAGKSANGRNIRSSRGLGG